ncbi:hypothetical protein B7P43_G11001 [Cryptotermes secundus]|uniref:Uncharacterized protein n=1 Tax=Cryptotermes secundus TaxID=105785 RepID=A0A2J7PPW8_9NEOP|nr:hypothetical protein B7P43_G11001 [Cryptotermes secundus]
MTLEKCLQEGNSPGKLRMPEKGLGAMVSCQQVAGRPGGTTSESANKASRAVTLT